MDQSKLLPLINQLGETIEFLQNLKTGLEKIAKEEGI